MATMIPPVFTQATLSPGEKQLFLKLKDDPKTSEWIVLHSLDIAHHTRQIQGEADFIVFIPGKGVLIVEVKAHNRIQRTPAGYWYLGNSDKAEVRGPFKQASDAMHSLYNNLKLTKPEFKNVVFWSCVIFTHTPFKVISDEWHPWQVVDTNLFNSKPISFTLENILDQARAFLATSNKAPWFNPKSSLPTPSECQEIAQVLRPNFDFYESPESRAKNLENELKYYTAEQFLALDRMAINPRVIFEGPAGTGKTLLAIEAARRAAETNQKVLLLCFNNLLGRWLEKQTATLSSLVTTRTLHSHMLKVAGLQTPENAHYSFWTDDLPAAALSKLEEVQPNANLFDLIIIDEAQDILRENYLAFLDKSLRRGFASGKWLIFGDFEKQAIYSSANLPLNEFRENWGNYAPVYSLRENCRNTPNIAEWVHLLGGLQPSYSKILRPSSDNNPKIVFYSNELQEQVLINDNIEELKKEGYQAQEIVILSPKSQSAFAAAWANNPSKTRIQPFDPRFSGSTISYCSIQAFKGLEAPAIIVTGIEKVGDLNSRALFYVAITRAVSRLIIIANKSAKKDLINSLSS